MDFSQDQVVKCSIRVAVEGTLLDPGQVTLQVRNPSGAQNDYTYPGTVEKESTGRYHYNLMLGTPGEWTVRWVTTNPAPGATDDFTLEVDPTSLG